MIINNVKFRAKIQDLDELVLVIDMDMDYNNGEIIELSVKGLQSKHGEFCFGLDDDPYGCYCYNVKYIEHLMMSLGEKDINGIEIFEGDIVKHRELEGNYLILNFMNNNLSIVSLNGSYGDIGFKDIEVVGNIWENWNELTYEERKRIMEVLVL